LNAGAALASGSLLLFLHADTTLPPDALDSLTALAEREDALWGRFDVSLDAPGSAYRVIETMMNLRSRLTGVATGDQAIFVTRALFEQVGGFPPIALMEDIALSKRLRREHRPHCLRSRVRTSARRWQRDGVVRTVIVMWGLRLAYVCGVSPARLRTLYERRHKTAK
jgi:rSAM/selenodomain-associated transferase 2